MQFCWNYSDFKLSDIEKFLADLPCTKAPKMKFGSKLLSEEEVARIEQTTVRFSLIFLFRKVYCKKLIIISRLWYLIFLMEFI